MSWPFSFPCPMSAGYHVGADPSALLNPAGTKRSLAELQQQAAFLRSVKQRGAAGHEQRRFPPPTSMHVDAEKMKNQLQELEKQLLEDDDEGDGWAGNSGLTSSEWSETVKIVLLKQPTGVKPGGQQRHHSPPSSSSSSPSSCTTAGSASNPQLANAAAAISEGQIDQAAAILAHLKQAASSSSPRAGTPDQRLATYLVSGLQARMNPPNPDDDSVAKAYGDDHMLYEASPCFELGFVAAGLAIVDATQGHRKLHILDFNVGHGGHAVAVLRALAERRRTSVRITAVASPSDSLLALSDRLAKLAGRLGIDLRFDSVPPGAQDLLPTGNGQDEALAVNFAFCLHRLPDESVTTANPRDELLRRVLALGPAVVALSEQNTSANTAPFLARFGEARAHYGSLFDSLDASPPKVGVERWRVEERLGQKAADAVAKEGADRVERCEVAGKWRARMGMAGFKPRPLPPHVAESVRAQMGSVSPGFVAREEAGELGLGWNDRILTFISTWR